MILCSGVIHRWYNFNSISSCYKVASPCSYLYGNLSREKTGWVRSCAINNSGDVIMAGIEHLILIVPIGPVDIEILTALGSALSAVFRLPAGKGEMLPIPPEAYNHRRRQYHSSRILDLLKPLRSPGVYRVLAVIDEDLYVPSLNFVFGEADIESGVTIISLARLRNEIYGYPPDNKLLLERTVKEAVHELGHTFGIGHCPDSQCIMYFSNSLEGTDRKGPSFCHNCRSKLTHRSIG